MRFLENRKLKMKVRSHIKNRNYGLIREYFPVYFKELYPYVLKENFTERVLWETLMNYNYNFERALTDLKKK